MAKFTGKMLIALQMIFLVREFFSCANFSFWDMFDFVYGWFCIWSILYIVYFDVCDLMYAKDLRDFYEPDSDADQWGYIGSAIHPKAGGVQGCRLQFKRLSSNAAADFSDPGPGRC